MSNGYGKQGGQHRHSGGSGTPHAGGPAERPYGGGRRDSGTLDDNPITRALQGAGRIEFWGDANRKSLRPELLDQEAQERARELHAVPPSQLRRFYGTIIAFKQRLRIDKTVNDGEVRAQLAYTKASAAYAGARKQPEALVKFFVEAANSVNTRDDFDAFARHFEAVVAYHKVFAEKEN